MNQPLVDEIVKAVLYEGYILYPYRPSSVKNRQRWSFGGIYPRAYSESQAGSDAWSMQTQCVVLARDGATIGVTVRFLHLLARTVERRGTDGDFHSVESLEAGGQSYQSWQEAVERSVAVDGILLAELAAHPRRQVFDFRGTSDEQQLRDNQGRSLGRVVRQQQPIQGEMELSADRKSDGLFVVTARIVNTTAMTGPRMIGRDDALHRSFVSTHSILSVRNGDFASLTDPPEVALAAAEGCSNIGCWPVLVGNPGDRDTMLSSPIILYDYPQIAPESPGDLFDGTEIDEILTLRIMTLTDEEKRQAAAADPRTAAMLARTETLARGQLMNLHGAMREVAPANSDSGAGNGLSPESLATEELHA